MKKGILFFGINPWNTALIDSGTEHIFIKNELKKSNYGNEFYKVAPPCIKNVTITKLHKRILSHKAPNILHLSAHCSPRGRLVFESEQNNKPFELIDPINISKILNPKSEEIECVILNACHSDKLAHVLSKKIKYVIGMKNQLHSRRAMYFSSLFYYSLGEGYNIKDAYNHASNMLSISNIPGKGLPVLKDEKIKMMNRNKKFSANIDFNKNQLDKVKHSLVDTDRKIIGVKDTLDKVTTQQVSLKAKLLEDNPYRKIISWLSIHKPKLIDQISTIVSSDFSVDKVKDFSFEIELLVDQLEGCFFMQNLELVDVEDIELIKLTFSQIYYVEALSLVQSKMENDAKFDNVSTLFISKVFKQLFKSIDAIT